MSEICFGVCVLCREGGFQAFREYVGILLPLGLPCCGSGVTWSLWHQLCHLTLQESSLEEEAVVVFQGMDGSVRLRLFEQLPRAVQAGAGISALPVTHLRCQGQSTDPTGMPRRKG